MRRFIFLLVVLAGWTISGGPPAVAEAVKHIGTSGKWLAYQFNEKGGRVCYLASAPVRSEGKYTRRGDIYVLVTHSRAAKSRGVVSVVAGYTFATDSEVEVRISGRKFKMFTQDDRAWTENGKADAKLVQAMKRGMKMEVRGRSSRGTKTRDIYSLKGFTAGMRMIDKACAG